MKKILIIVLILITKISVAQDTVCVNKTIEHKIHSKHLNEDRNYWISLPEEYSDSLEYPVIYVLDAEWRFDLIKSITFDLGANKKIKNSIVVGIPHIDDKKRGLDLTFSQSRIRYDGKEVDSTWYNASNSGQGTRFYDYLTKELIPNVNKNYSANNHKTLIGHSFGGYFTGYILSFEHPFDVIHIYDPAIWYGDGEVVERFKNTKLKKRTKIYLTYQSKPEFHKNKIEEFISILGSENLIDMTIKFYPNETHNSLYMDSFYKGIVKTNK